MKSSGLFFAVLSAWSRRRQLLFCAGALAAAAPVAAQRSGGGAPEDGGGFGPDFIPVRPVVVFFPPTPPPLDRAISHLAAPMPPRLTPPPELASYINEPFYAPLSTWLAEKALAEKMRDRIAALRAAEIAALTELRATLEKQREAEPAVRLHAIEELARRQAPKLTAQEREADLIRADLAIGSYDWRARREWTLGSQNARGDSPLEIAAVMRAYAFYQSGLTPPQRRLLREIALELAAAGEDTTAAQAAQPYLFLPPEPARVILRDDVPDAIAASVAIYQTKKSLLKKELFDVVYKQDSASFGFTRSVAIKALAERQAARFAELETLTEQIRRGLAQAPSAPVPAPERSPLPPILTGRVAEILQARTALHKDAIARVEAIRQRYSEAPVQINYAFEGEILKYIVVPRRSRDAAATADLKELARRIEGEFAIVAEDFNRGFSTLTKDIEGIRRDTAATLVGATPREVENAISGATRAVALRENEDAYREYRTAVFEPGMSPEQRRLLFGFALEKLDLPLPRGEFQPMQRAPSW